MAPDTPAEILRLREKLHDLSDHLQTVELVVAELKGTHQQIESIASSLDSLAKSVTSNNAEILQRLTGSERWQSTYEKLDGERWGNFKNSLGEIKGLIESVPIKVAEDISKINLTLAEHEKSLNLLRGAWFALAALGAVVEFFLHLKGG